MLKHKNNNPDNKSTHPSVQSVVVERDGEKWRDTQTDRQIDSQTETETDRDRDRERQRDKETDRDGNRQTDT